MGCRAGLFPTARDSAQAARLSLRQRDFSGCRKRLGNCRGLRGESEDGRCGRRGSGGGSRRDGACARACGRSRDRRGIMVSVRLRSLRSHRAFGVGNHALRLGLRFLAVGSRAALTGSDRTRVGRIAPGCDSQRQRSAAASVADAGGLIMPIT